jgi:hypothetical protein
VLRSPEDLAGSEHSAFTGAIIHMIIDQVEVRVSWAEKMSARLATDDPETMGTAALDLYTDAQVRLRALVDGVS